MSRVTQPGGTVAAAVWDYGQGMEMLRVFWDEAVALNRDADARDERRMPLSADGELAALRHKQGLQEIVSEPAGAYPASLPATDAEQLRLRLRRRLIGDGPDAPIVLRARAWTVRGTVAR